MKIKFLQELRNSIEVSEEKDDRPPTPETLLLAFVEFVRAIPSVDLL